MKNQIVFLCFLLLGLLIIACQPKQEAVVETETETADATPKMTSADSIKEGEYLATILDCHACHTPKIMTDRGPVPDLSRSLAGHTASEVLPAITDKKMIAPGQWALASPGFTAWVGPWGTSFTANLTPHETGTGTWTLDNFSRALRQGKFKGLENGRTLLPPMPWESFAKMRDEHVAYLWAYIRSLPPIDNTVPAPLPPM